jgi:GNAT superfamily N-acetyltransferase
MVINSCMRIYEFLTENIIRKTIGPAVYIHPDSVKYSYIDEPSGSNMDVVTRPDSGYDVSVLDLYVPEEYRGLGIGKKLQARVLQDFPSLMGQVSSKAAAVNAYKAGRRPMDNPNATIDDVFAAIDDMSSVNLVTHKR